MQLNESFSVEFNVKSGIIGGIITTSFPIPLTLLETIDYYGQVI